MAEHYLRVLHCLANCLEELKKGKAVPADHYLRIAIWDIESKKELLQEHGMMLHDTLSIARCTLNLADAPSSETLQYLKKAYELIGKEVFGGI